MPGDGALFLSAGIIEKDDTARLEPFPHDRDKAISASLGFTRRAITDDQMETVGQRLQRRIVPTIRSIVLERLSAQDHRVQLVPGKIPLYSCSPFRRVFQRPMTLASRTRDRSNQEG